MKKVNFKIISLFCIVFCALMFKYWSIWGLWNDSIKYVFFVLSIVFALLSIIDNKYTRNQITRISLMAILSVIICYITGEIDFIYSFLIALIFVGEEKGDYLFVKFFVIAGIILFGCTIFMGNIGIISSYKTVRLVDGILNYRNSLGFEHVNAGFKNFFPLCLGLYILFYNKKKFSKIILYVILIGIGIYLYSATNSRTGFYAILMIAPFDLILSNINKTKDYKVSKYYFLIFSIISVLIAFVFGTSSNSINTMLSGRPILYYNVLTKTNISFFASETNGMVDNTYIWLMYHRGLIVYFCYLLIYMFSSKKMLKNKAFVLPLLLFCMYSTLENLDVYNYNFLLILEIMVLLLNDNKKYRWIDSYKKAVSEVNEK